MFSINSRDRKSRPATRTFLLSNFDDQDEVWELGSTRVWLIGDASELDEDDVADAVLIGTVAHVAEELNDA